MESRLDVIYGTGFMHFARLHDSSVVLPEARTASEMTAASLAAARDDLPFSYVDGLMHRALSGERDSADVHRLESELALLEQCR